MASDRSTAPPDSAEVARCPARDWLLAGTQMEPTQARAYPERVGTHASVRPSAAPGPSSTERRIKRWRFTRMIAKKMVDMFLDKMEARGEILPGCKAKIAACVL